MSATFSVQKPRGKGFEKGRAKTGGRVRGSRNEITRDIKWAIFEAARRVGGVDRLVEWIMESPKNEHSFWTGIWPRLIPLLIQGSGPGGELEVSVKLTAEELTKKLEERGLPLLVFGGVDKPLLELEAGKAAGDHLLVNGAGNGSDCLEARETLPPAEE
jgi:hypothetical protein